MRLAAACAVVLLLTASTVAGQVLFQMDASAGAQSTAGFDAITGDRYGITIARTYDGTGGPSGVPAYRFSWIHDPLNTVCGAPDFCGGEFDFGWYADTGTAPTSGQSRYARFAFRVVSGSNCEAKDSLDGTDPTRLIYKMIILGDGADGRTIVELRCDAPGTTFSVRLSQDGDGVGDVTGLTQGTWYYVQTQTVVGTGGSLRMWVNNDTEGSPDVVATGRDMGAAQYDLVGFGAYSNRQIGVDGIFAVDYSAFEYATTFDSAWFSGAATVPDAPTIGTATAGNGQCSVAFTPPADDGGSTITGYTATSTPGSFTGTAASSPITVTGLSNGTGYTFTVYATNAEGNSTASSASNTCTPSAAGGAIRLRLRG